MAQWTSVLRGCSGGADGRLGTCASSRRAPTPPLPAGVTHSYPPPAPPAAATSARCGTTSQQGVTGVWHTSYSARGAPHARKRAGLWAGSARAHGRGGASSGKPARCEVHGSLKAGCGGGARALNACVSRRAKRRSAVDEGWGGGAAAQATAARERRQQAARGRVGPRAHQHALRVPRAGGVTAGVANESRALSQLGGVGKTDGEGIKKLMNR